MLNVPVFRDWKPRLYAWPERPQPVVVVVDSSSRTTAAEHSMELFLKDIVVTLQAESSGSSVKPPYTLSVALCDESVHVVCQDKDPRRVDLGIFSRMSSASGSIDLLAAAKWAAATVEDIVKRLTPNILANLRFRYPIAPPAVVFIVGGTRESQSCPALDQLRTIRVCGERLNTAVVIVADDGTACLCLSGSLVANPASSDQLLKAVVAERGCGTLVEDTLQQYVTTYRRALAAVRLSSHPIGDEIIATFGDAQTELNLAATPFGIDATLIRICDGSLVAVVHPAATIYARTHDRGWERYRGVECDENGFGPSFVPVSPGTILFDPTGHRSMRIQAAEHDAAWRRALDPLCKEGVDR